MSPTTTAAQSTNELPETTARATANLINAQLSTGPRTAEGKAKMRFNALQHGLYSETVVLPNENRVAYEDLGYRLDRRFTPQNEEEHRFVQLLQDTEWRLGRISGLESGLLAIGSAQHLDSVHENYGPLDQITAETLAQSAGFLANARAFDQLSRHEARLRRLYDKTERELIQLIAQRGVSPETSTVGSVPKVPSAPFIPTRPAPAPAPVNKSTMPKFTGPLRKQHRKEWIRTQTRKNVSPDQA